MADGSADAPPPPLETGNNEGLERPSNSRPLLPRWPEGAGPPTRTTWPSVARRERGGTDTPRRGLAVAVALQVALQVALLLLALLSLWPQLVPKLQPLARAGATSAWSSSQPTCSRGPITCRRWRARRTPGGAAPCTAPTAGSGCRRPTPSAPALSSARRRRCTCRGTRGSWRSGRGWPGPG